MNIKFENLVSKSSGGILLYFLIAQTVFLTATWLPHSQLWATVEEAASLTRC